MKRVTITDVSSEIKLVWTREFYKWPELDIRYLLFVSPVDY